MHQYFYKSIDHLHQTCYTTRYITALEILPMRHLLALLAGLLVGILAVSLHHIRAALAYILELFS